MNGICLFAGSGIGEIALKRIWPEYRTVCFVEWDGYAISQIIARIRDGHIEDSPIWNDVQTFSGKEWRGFVDVVSGGFPCQPFSVAGNLLGESDPRNMWPETIRIIGEIRPKIVLLENVSNILVSGYEQRIFGDLAKIGYDCRWDIVGASDIGAKHQRNRLWIVGVDRKYSDTTGGDD